MTDSKIDRKIDRQIDIKYCHGKRLGADIDWILAVNQIDRYQIDRQQDIKYKRQWDTDSIKWILTGQ